MQHFPIFIAVQNRQIVLSGGGEAAVAKLRLLMKTEAKIVTFAAKACDEIKTWAAQDRLQLVPRALNSGDVTGAVLFYAANENAEEDARAANIAKAEGALVNIVDNLAESQFITPAIVDRDPVTVAIGTEGAAPVLARAIKADIEAQLPTSLGILARIGKAFRDRASALPYGRRRRDFWSDFYFRAGPRAFAKSGPEALKTALSDLLDMHMSKTPRQGHVAFVGAGPGDPDLLTLRARRLLDHADVVLHDRLVTPEILELARREAHIIDVGKTSFGPATSQGDINAMLCVHALKGAQVVRLKGGDPTLFGRLDEELDACDTHRIAWSIVPGITAASAAVASIGQSLTKRRRNVAVRFLSGQDINGFADHDWALLARPDEIVALYMSTASARFIQGRLLMHGAAAETPITLVENASRPNERVVTTTLADLAQCHQSHAFKGPVISLYGLAPRAAVPALQHILQKDLA